MTINEFFTFAVVKNKLSDRIEGNITEVNQTSHSDAGQRLLQLVNDRLKLCLKLLQRITHTTRGLFTTRSYIRHINEIQIRLQLTPRNIKTTPHTQIFSYLLFRQPQTNLRCNHTQISLHSNATLHYYTTSNKILRYPSLRIFFHPRGVHLTRLRSGYHLLQLKS